MTESSSDPAFAPDIDDPTRFLRLGVAAHALGAAQTRLAFGTWLQRYLTLTDQRLNDVVIAVNEALANAAEFAHPVSGDSDTMDVLATYAPETDTLNVAVSDHGRWQGPAPNPLARDPLRVRGRGIPLMQSLADDTTIMAATTGTRVTLMWTGLSAGRAD